MMATTHALVGLLLAAVVAVVDPAASPVVLAAAVAGGGFPDLDLYAGHRRTLHYPVYYALGAIAAGATAIVIPGVLPLAAALFLAGAALHSLMDVFGGGLELRPWEATSDRGVYSHFHGRWIAPRRWVRYDGAPEDLGLAVLVAVPSLLVFGQSVDLAVYAVLAVSAGYALLRKPMVVVAERLVRAVPAKYAVHVPDRFVGDLR